jgi:hypothetical protein
MISQEQANVFVGNKIELGIDNTKDKISDKQGIV